MRLVVFGAGASYDSSPTLRPQADNPLADGWRPPLADGLFSDRPEFRDLLTRFPRIIPLVARLGRPSPTRSLESMLSRLLDEAADYPERHCDLAAIRYYLQFLLWECERFWHPDRFAVTNYISLLDRIQRWRRGRTDTLFATFNYDRLFEYAATFYLTRGQHIYRNDFATIDSYIANPDFPFIKLHGSIDWGHRVETPLDVVAASNNHVWQIANEVTRIYPDLVISSQIVKILERPPQPQEGRAFVPAIALPLDSKAEFVCPKEHLEFLAARLPHVTSILLIGWRGLEPHFLSLLAQNLPTKLEILAVSGSVKAAQETLNNLQSAGIAGVRHPYSGGFSDLIASDDLDAFLARE